MIFEFLLEICGFSFSYLFNVAAGPYLQKISENFKKENDINFIDIYSFMLLGNET